MATANVLTINGGSSSIRFALFAASADPLRRWAGKLDRLGLAGTKLMLDGAQDATPWEAGGNGAVEKLLDWFESQPDFASIAAIGHRVVQGMSYCEPQRITQDLLAELHRVLPYDPEHLPREIELIEAIHRRHPAIAQIACFDTAFHRHIPTIAQLLPIPRRYFDKGIRRYGFHGLSYGYLAEELRRLGEPAIDKGRVILAHLGNGASVAAVLDGRSIDTSMAFTPSAGMVMSSRSGDLDPGLVSYLARTEQMSADQFQNMVNHESGLLGISGLSSDMRDLLAQEAANPKAAQAIDLFCYHAKKWIGSMAAVLGGVDMLVFAGGIGENSPSVRQRICEGLGFLGVSLDEARNAAGAPLISPEPERLRIRVMRTDEERMIANSVIRLLDLDAGRRVQV